MSPPRRRAVRAGSVGVALAISALAHAGVAAMVVGGWLWHGPATQRPRLELAQGEQAVIPSVRLLTAEQLEQMQRREPMHRTRSLPEVRVERPKLVDVNVDPLDIVLPGPSVELRRERGEDLPQRFEHSYELTDAPPEQPAPRPTQTTQPVPTPTPPAEPDTAQNPTPPTETATASSQPAGVSRGAAIIDLPTPIYPPLSRRLGEQGVVLLGATIGSDGRATNIAVVRAPPHPRLVEAAKRALAEARFKPAMHRGEPTTQHVEIPFAFELRD